MATTRSASRNLKTRRAIYRKHLKASRCRGEPRGHCKLRNQCKHTKRGTRKSYCRTQVNKKA